MRKVELFVLFLLFAGISSRAQAFTASLSGTRPGSSGYGASTGVALVELSGSTVTYALFYFGATTPTAAHIHQGFAGATGSVVVDFSPSFTPVGGAFVATGIVVLEPSVASAIRANPAG